VNEKNFSNLTDQQLLENFYKDHDNTWLGILLQRYTLLLLGVSMKYLKNEEEAKDCVQQIFIKVILELQKYRVTYFKSWIYMVVKNQCLMRLREKQTRITTELNEALLATADEETDKPDLLQNDYTLELMNESLNELNPEQKQCVTLFYLQKKSYREISESTGYSLLQVKSYIQNGKRNLKGMIEKKLNEKQSHR
jgi:RNA polymerase sigma factor (sigma-70 family)